MRHHLGRLSLVLLALALTAICSLSPASASVNCSQFNKPGCYYTWDAAAGCCRPNFGTCVWYCF